MGEAGKIAVSLHNYGGKGRSDTHGRVDCFMGFSLANPSGVCYTDIVNMEKCPIETKGHKSILFYHNWDRLSRPISFFMEKTPTVWNQTVGAGFYV